MLQSRLVLAGLLCLVGLTAGCSSLPGGPDPTVEGEPTAEPPATPTQSETASPTGDPREPEDPYTIPADERLEIVAETDANLTVAIVEYVGPGPRPNSTAIDSGNWTVVESVSYEGRPAPQRHAVTAFEPDGWIVVSRNGTVVWERRVETYERFVVRITDTGEGEVIDGAVV